MANLPMPGLRIRVQRRRPRAAGQRRRVSVRRMLLATIGLVAIAGIAGGVRIHSFATEAVASPHVTGPDVIASLIETTPVSITTTVLWQKIPAVITTHALLHDRTVWRRMHFDDWDRIAPPLRERAMGAMIAAYASVHGGPERWARMSTHDWDAVPQPVRALAYLRMVWHWAEAERVGVEFGWQPRHLAPTIAAIVMAESWFEHRAVNENSWGNRDLGLAQCSDHCRDTLAQMAAAGEVPFLLEEEQYFNPWYATRVATVWFQRELQRADGDIDLAIRAYHRGMDAALDDKGDRYLAGVHDKRTRFVLNHGGASESWQFLVREIAATQRGAHSAD